MVAPRWRASVSKFAQHGDGPVIERSERFIQQQNLGRVNKRARQRQPLPHAARILAHRHGGHARQAHAFEPRVGKRFHMAAAAGDAGKKMQIFARGKIFVNANAVPEKTRMPASIFGPRLFAK